MKNNYRRVIIDTCQTCKNRRVNQDLENDDVYIYCDLDNDYPEIGTDYYLYEVALDTWRMRHTVQNYCVCDNFERGDYKRRWNYE